MSELSALGAAYGGFAYIVSIMKYTSSESLAKTPVLDSAGMPGCRSIYFLGPKFRLV